MAQLVSSRTSPRSTLSALTMVGLIAALPNLSQATKAQVTQGSDIPKMTTDPLLDQRPGAIGDAHSVISLEGMAYVIDYVRDVYLPSSSGATATYRPHHLPHLGRVADSNSIAFGKVIGAHQHGYYGVKVRLKWSTEQLRALCLTDCRIQDAEYIKSQGIGHINAEPYRNRAAIVYLQDANTEAVVSDVVHLKALRAAHGDIGTDCVIFMPPDIAKKFIDGNGKDFNLCAAFLPYGYNTLSAEQKWTASQNDLTKLENSLTNEQLTKKAPIYQIDYNKIYTEVAVSIKSERFGSAPEAVAFLDGVPNEFMSQFLQSLTLTGQEAINATREPGYQQMMATWLEALRTHNGLTKDDVDITITDKGRYNISVNRNSHLKGDSSTDRSTILWGLFGSGDSSKMSGEEMTKEMIKKIVNMVERETGTTLRQVSDETGYVPHQVRVYVYREATGRYSIDGTTATTIASGQLTGYWACRPMPAHITDKDIDQAAAVAMKKSEELRAAEERTNRLNQTRENLSNAEEIYRERQLSGKDLFRQLRELEIQLEIERQVLAELNKATTVIVPTRSRPADKDVEYPNELSVPIISKQLREALKNPPTTQSELDKLINDVKKAQELNEKSLSDCIKQQSTKKAEVTKEIDAIINKQTKRLEVLKDETKKALDSAAAEVKKMKQERDRARARLTDFIDIRKALQRIYNPSPKKTKPEPFRRE